MPDTTREPVPFFRPSFTEAEEEAVIRVLRSGWLTTGSEALAFEREFAAFTGSPRALAVNSASSGLMLAMQAFGVGPGAKILTTPYTFVSTATSAIHLGAEVAYADIGKDGYNIDTAGIEEALKRDRTIRAIVPVHIAGLPCDMAAIMETARRFGIPVIEDAAHAFPSRTPGGFIGTIGDAGVFSFYATKTITTGEGGMICLRDEEAASRISCLRSHGIDRTIWDRYTSDKASWLYDVTTEGWKCNLPDILAAIGRVQLTKADEFFRRRKAIAERMSAAFAASDLFITPPDGPGNAWHLYLLRINTDRLSVDRDTFARALQAEGLGVSLHFIPHFEMTWCKRRYGLTRADFPQAYKQFSTTVTLPFWPDMDEKTVERVIDTVLTVGERFRRRQG